MFDSSGVDMHGVDHDIVAIDFGASNTDIAALVDRKLHLWSERRQGLPSVQGVHDLLKVSGLRLHEVQRLAVTGGHHQVLPDDFDGIPVTKVGELAAIARGGQALACGSWRLPTDSLLVVSAGSGTAMVVAQGNEYRHVTGSGVGGGTLLGLGRLLLGSNDPMEINRLASLGTANGADLTIRDVVSGQIGSLPADATAVNFGRLASNGEVPSREDLAAALVNMIGQVIATLATNAAHAAGVTRGVVTGHMTDMETLRNTMALVGTYFGVPLEISSEAGFATVIGALLRASEV